MIQNFVTSTVGLKYLRKLIDPNLSPTKCALSGSKILHRNTGIICCWGEQVSTSHVRQWEEWCNEYVYECLYVGSQWCRWLQQVVLEVGKLDGVNYTLLKIKLSTMLNSCLILLCIYYLFAQTLFRHNIQHDGRTIAVMHLLFDKCFVGEVLHRGNSEQSRLLCAQSRGEVWRKDPHVVKNKDVHSTGLLCTPEYHTTECWTSENNRSKEPDGHDCSNRTKLIHVKGMCTQGMQLSWRQLIQCWHSIDLGHNGGES